ncbi:hypothetical protein [Flagellimonas sp.]|uniref:hypothetical protein n=1 Tax=Flagellimonas sp. TaxID=2058762 RepID=UPI003BAB061C
MRKIFHILLLFACFYSFGQISSDSSVVGIHKKGEGLFETGGAIIGSDNQQITNFSITSNILTLTLEDGGTQTVDLSPYLDNESVASGSVSGTDLILTLTDASTVTIDMSSFSGGSSTALATTYDNTTSGLSATNVKDGLDELATASISLSSINKNADYTITGTEEDRIVAAKPALNDSIVFTINDGVFSGPGFIKFLNKGDGFIAVEQGTIPYMNGDYKTAVGPGSTISLRIEHQDSVYVEPSDLLAYTPITIDPDAQALITAIGTLTPTEETAVNNLFTTWKSSTYYSKLLVVNGFIGGTAAEHKWNFVDPRDLDVAFRPTFTGVWTHDANGITGDAVAAYANTHFVPATELTATSYSFGVYYQSNTDSSGAIGVRDGTGGSFLAYYPNFSGTFYSYMGDDANPVTVASIGTTKGLYSSTQNGGTTHKAFRNGVQIGTTNTGDNTAAFGLLAEPFYLGALNGDGVAEAFSNRTISFFFIAEGLTDAEMLHFYNSIEAYQTELSR